MKLTTNSILTFLFSQCMLASLIHANPNKKFLRRRNTNDMKRQIKHKVESTADETCLIILYGSSGEEKEDRPANAACEMEDGSILDISGWSHSFIKEKVKEGLIISSESRLRLTGLKVGHFRGLVNVPDNASLLVGPHAAAHRKLAVVEGTKTILVVRAQPADSEVTHSEAALSDDIFGTAPGQVSLSSQYTACSHGKLNFVKASSRTGSGYNILNGVATVPLPIITSTVNTQHSVMRDAITASLKSNFGVSSPNILADHVMYCLPPGTAGIATSYAAVNHWMSVYPDHRCMKQSSQFHEIGHNLNLAHSAEGDLLYGDATGAMGPNDEADDGPQLCFNAAKSWQLGWYSGKTTVIDAIQNPTFTGHLAGIVDYSSTTHMVLLKIQSASNLNYYVSFNKQAGFNSGTKEAGNMVTVVQKPGDESTYEVSDLVGKLGAGDVFVDNSFDGQNVLVVSVSSITSDHAAISVTIGSKCLTNSDCDDGLFCNGAETCSIHGSCVAGTAQCIGLGELCNDDANQCEEFCANDADCDDTLYCNGVETCDKATNKCVAGAAPVCDDGIFCNGVEVCDELSNSCRPGAPPVCDDGIFCNGVETCSTETDACVAGTPVTCDSSTCGGQQVCSDSQKKCVDQDVGFGLGNDGVCDISGGESCSACPGDCNMFFAVPAECGNGICEEGENCNNCPADCNGKTNGKSSDQFCCAGGPAGGCSVSQCNISGLYQCTTALAGIMSCCGDGICEGKESISNCPADCSISGTAVAATTAMGTTTRATTVTMTTTPATTTSTTAATTTHATTTTTTTPATMATTPATMSTTTATMATTPTTTTPPPTITTVVVPVNSACEMNACEWMDKGTCDSCSAKCTWLNGKEKGCFPN